MVNGFDTEWDHRWRKWVFIFGCVGWVINMEQLL